MKLNIQDAKNSLKHYNFPQDIIVEVTSFCNLQCIMCPQSALTREKGEMKFEVFKKIVDEIAIENPTSRLWLAIMGEPTLLKEKLIKMIEYAKSKGIKSIHLNTNACLLTEKLSNKIVTSGISEIIVGLDAYTKETYDKIRKKGDFNQTINNVEYLLKTINKKKSNLKLIMQFIVMNENEHEIELFKKHWIDKGLIVKIRPKLGWGKGVKTEYLNLSDSERNFPCPWLVRTVSIHWNGKFAQCDADYNAQYSPGDLNNHTIKEIWIGELAKRRYRHWENDFNHELCQECKDWQAGRSSFYYPEPQRNV